jgi:hypothetical protein
MANPKSLWIVLAFASMLITGVTLTDGVAAPSPGGASKHAVPKKSLTSEEALKVRKSEEKRTASLDKSYKQQRKALAKHYKELAKLVKKQGGDPTPLQEAADYFDNQAKD